MKLVIQIPAWDEEGQIAAAIRELPRQVPGFSKVEVLVVDDGSTDATSRVAMEAGADHVLRLGIHRGLAVAWRAGLDRALALGADVVVSTDADRQYAAADVVTLVEPILRGEAEIVVGDRGVATKPDFPPGKRLVQRLGSWVVRRASGTDVPDATSGFRALTREAALRLNVYTRMTYTTETLIQAGHKNMAVRSVRVGTNPPVRPSRLFRRTSRYVLVQGANILRMSALYKPLPIFLGLSAGGVLKPEMVKTMAPHPLILALANPTPEILPEQVKAVRDDAVIATGDLAGAEARLVQAGELAARLNRGYEAVQVLTLRALLAERGGQSPDSLLTEALSRAQSGGLVRVFADTLPEVVELVRRRLQDAPAKILTRTFIDRVLAAAEATPPAEQQPAQSGRSALLTPKESHVLQLLAGDLQNKQIATELDLSSDTVKWHVKKLLAKLNAGNRDHAVDRARMLGLLR